MRLPAFLRRVQLPEPLRTSAETPVARARAAEILRRTEEFNRNADTYWRDVKADPAGRRHVLNRPLGNVGEAAHLLYRVGIVLAELRPGLGHTVLDFAAGSGWLSAWLNRLGCRTIALDVSPTALELARELFALDARQRLELRPEFLRYDGRRIPLPDASVDRIVSFDGFHHVPNPDEVLRELARVLRPGGRAVFAEPGEGHAEMEASRVETEKAGVLENELDVATFARSAEQAGFTSVQLKPYPDPASIRLAPDDYLRLQAGDDARFPMAALRDSLRRFYLFVLAKGEERYDTRAPGLLRAEIRVGAAGVLRGPGRSSVSVPVSVRNLGDTLWLSEPDPLGGYVMLAGHLHSARGDRVVRGAFRAPLPRPVPPGESVELQLAVPLPAEVGRYAMELDLVDENVAWFGQAGSPTARLELEVDRLGEQDEPDALRARLETSAARLSARPGTSLTVPVRVGNTGRRAWPPSGPETVRLAGHLLAGSGGVLAPDFLRAGLPAAVEPGASLELDARFPAPLEPGAYRLKLDMVLEHVCWFEQRGSLPLEIALEVRDETPDSAEPGLLRAALERLGVGGPLMAPAGSQIALDVRVDNAGNTLWLHEPRARGGQVALGAHLRDAAAKLLTLDFLRVPLPRDVPPGDRVELRFDLRLPDEPGRYLLELDMVDEGLEWFAASGSPTLSLEVIALAREQAP